MDGGATQYTRKPNTYTNATRVKPDLLQLKVLETSEKQDIKIANRRAITRHVTVCERRRVRVSASLTINQGESGHKPTNKSATRFNNRAYLWTGINIQVEVYSKQKQELADFKVQLDDATPQLKVSK
ncbi:hypothetical protein JYU34_000430 [Plutella xylostella]|uniref:Uncharacterized protein n=1 Tax=Plutella xylostella TaxID=51655 RepID=A0ABQ7R7P4_PLUXY|nr:hypothetical protein JYU34_000430 [Plutella xylostella]